MSMDKGRAKRAQEKILRPSGLFTLLLQGLIDAFFDQLLDNGGIFKGADIAEVVLFFFGNFSEDAAHDFAAARFRKRIGKLQFVRNGNGADFGSNLLQQFRLEFPGRFDTEIEGHKGVNSLALDFMGHSGSGRFSDCRMKHQGAFNFGRADAMTGHVDNVIDPALEKIIAFFILQTAVTGKIHARIRGKISILVAFMILVDGPGQARPGALDAKMTDRFGRHRFYFVTWIFVTGG